MAMTAQSPQCLPGRRNPQVAMTAQSPQCLPGRRNPQVAITAQSPQCLPGRRNPQVAITAQSPQCLPGRRNPQVAITAQSPQCFLTTLTPIFGTHRVKMAAPGFVLKNRRTTLERAEKFVSDKYFTDCNLKGR